jgi:hypothetical protein
MILFFTENRRFNISVQLNGRLYVEVDNRGLTLTQQESRELILSLEKAKTYVFPSPSD